MQIKTQILFALVGLLGIAPHAFANTETPSKKPVYREITPNAGPRVASGADLFFTADFLWWRAQQNGMVFGTTGELISAPTAFGPLSEGRYAVVDYNWEPGFKVGMGVNLSHDGWDLYAEYTWLHAHGSNQMSGPGPVVPGTVLPFGVTSSFPTAADRATSQSTLHFNVIDLELGRNFYVSQFLSLRPHFGFKGTWQREDWNTRYFGNSFQVNVNQGPPVPLTGPYRLRQFNKYYGVGVRAGLDTAWHFTSNWSIFGDIAWTAMWSKYRLKRVDVVSDTNAGQSQNNFRIHSDFYEVKYIGELQIGLRFEMWFYESAYHIQLQAGWEEQVWINHQTYIQALVPGSYYDLNIHGLTLMGRFDF